VATFPAVQAAARTVDPAKPATLLPLALARMAAQARLGVPPLRQSPISRDETTAFVRLIADARPEQRQRAVDNVKATLEAGYGPVAPLALDMVLHAAKLDPAVLSGLNEAPRASEPDNPAIRQPVEPRADAAPQQSAREVQPERQESGTFESSLPTPPAQANAIPSETTKLRRFMPGPTSPVPFPEDPNQAFLDRARLVDYAGAAPAEQPPSYWDKFAQTPTGRFLRDAFEALKLPGDVYAGRIDPWSEEGRKRTTDLAGLVAGGAPVAGMPRLAAREAAANVEAELASRNARLYNPPVKDVRPFKEDYRGGAQADETGRLLHDIDGRPLGARFVVGRKEVGGGDAALPEEALDAIAEATTGRAVALVPKSALGRNVGSVKVNRYSRQPLSAAVWNQLTAAQLPRVAAHEIGHVIDQAAGEIPTEGLSRELAQVYNTLNTGQERTRSLTGPQHQGYIGDDVPRELMAEAIRAYMVDPNYLKAVAPKTAARIRDYVNANPRLAATIQFNAGSPFGLLTLDTGDQADGSPLLDVLERQQRSP